MKFFRGLAFYVLLIGVGMAVVLFPIDNEVSFVILLTFLVKDLQKVSQLMDQFKSAFHTSYSSLLI